MPGLKVLAAVSVLLLSGCVSFRYSDLAPVLGSHGAHAVWTRSVLSLRFHEFVTVLPGSQRVACARSEVARGRLRVSSCGPVERSWVQAFERAIDEFDRVFPETQLNRASVHLYPSGARVVRRDRGVSYRGSANIELGFRYSDEDQRYLRYAVRTLAHEYSHVALRQRSLSPDDDELLAGLLESCVEYSVFGSTRGSVFRAVDEAPESINDAQRRSHVMGQEADAVIHRFLGGSADVASDEAFEEFCDQLPPVS